MLGENNLVILFSKVIWYDIEETSSLHATITVISGEVQRSREPEGSEKLNRSLGYLIIDLSIALRFSRDDDRLIQTPRLVLKP